MSRALSFSFHHKGFLNGYDMTHTHSSYGLRRNFITYNIKITLPHLGSIMFIELHGTRFFNKSGGLIVDSMRGISPGKSHGQGPWVSHRDGTGWTILVG